MFKINKKQLDEDIDEVLMALAYIDNLKDMRNFTNDLFTDSELKTMAMRWKAVRMLRAGITYTKITKMTGMSSATIALLAKKLGRRSGGFSNLLIEMGA